MKLEEMQKVADSIRRRYAALNAKDGHNKWSGKDYAMGFAGDFGDLQKLIMAKENMRDIDDVDAKLRHELADCLWSLLVLADHYSIDMEQAFEDSMEDLSKRLAEAGV